MIWGEITWVTMVTMTRMTPRRVSPSLPANQRSGPWRRWRCARHLHPTVNTGLSTTPPTWVDSGTVAWSPLRPLTLSLFQVQHVQHGQGQLSSSSAQLMFRVQDPALHDQRSEWRPADHGDSSSDTTKQDDHRQPPGWPSAPAAAVLPATSAQQSLLLLQHSELWWW